MYIIINEKYYAFQSDFGAEEYLKCAICEMSDLISYSNDISHVSYGHFKIMSKTTLDEYELEHDGFTKISSGDLSILSPGTPRRLQADCQYDTLL